MNAFKDGKKMGWVDPEDIDDDAWIICTYGMGSIALPYT